MAWNEKGWQSAAEGYAWMVPWRYVRDGDGWFVGGYSNVAWNAVDRHLECMADHTAVSDRASGQRFTYRDLYWKSARLARWWRDHGLAVGERVVIYGAGGLTALVAWLAAARIGAVAVLMPSTPSSGLLSQRLNECEASWVVVESREEALAVGRQTSVPVLVGGQDPVGPSLADVEERAAGLIDPVPVEANALGVLVYGDDGRPYAYAGLGGLISWAESLALNLDLAGGDRIGVWLSHQGLSHRLIVTLALLAKGAQVVWMGEDVQLAVREHGLQKLVVSPCDARRAAAGADRLDVILVLGHSRITPALPSDGRARWRQAIPHISAGLFLPREGGMDPGPGQDRTRGSRPPETTGTPPESVWDQLLQVPDVEEVYPMEDADTRIVWVRSGHPLPEPDERALPVPFGWTPVVLDAFPETIEGRVAGQVLASLWKHDSRISLDGVANPAVVEQLVRTLGSH
ncbi:AMP-binding protein [Sulfobacillus harzensis]|uniref:Propionyl-CoA synthetase n=1 Tax=Sulfobacillus harzensis TaxID=2729629 RepID=A0A7Y0L1N2_9FIRM|nr:AMP-binding protein [Sulfobacillus harzensis]NMP21101.1 propionyl-CoA synthetase [Sulfobacillus harzensis]